MLFFSVQWLPPSFMKNFLDGPDFGEVRQILASVGYDLIPLPSGSEAQTETPLPSNLDPELFSLFPKLIPKLFHLLPLFLHLFHHLETKQKIDGCYVTVIESSINVSPGFF
jgi:hypothetical protein